MTNTHLGAKVLSTLLWRALAVLTSHRDDKPRPHDAMALSHPSEAQSAAQAQFHAAEYASERNSVDVWKTLQYALVPIMLNLWYLLIQVSSIMPLVVFRWACAAVLPLCLIAYQKAMVDALTGVLLIEERVRPLAIRLAGTDEFWLHEPVYRKQVPPDAAYGWYTPPTLSFLSPLAMLAYRVTLDPSLPRVISWADMVGYTLCCLAACFVGGLSKKGLALNREIDKHIRKRDFSWLRAEGRLSSLPFGRSS